MFLGQTQSTVENGRLPFPTNFKEYITGGVYVTQGFDQNVLVLTATAFQELYERIVSLNMANPAARMLQRLILGSASFLEVGEKQLIQLPEALMKYAGLSSEAVIVGQGDYMEVWSPSQWKMQQQQIVDALASNADHFAGLIITTRSRQNSI